MKHPQQKRRIKSHNQKQIGQALVEFSLILPMLLVLILGIIDFGRIIFIYSDVATRTRDAAREATLTGDVTFSGVTTKRYIACDNIENLAVQFFGANAETVESVDILYYDTTHDPVDTTKLAATAAALDALVYLNDDDDTSPATATTPGYDWRTDIDVLNGADFDCNDGAGGSSGNGSFNSIPERLVDSPNTRVVSKSDIETGDLVVVMVDVKLEFITPFLDLMDAFLDRSAPGTFDVTFRAQRTLVKSIVLVTSGTDRDGDGLLDEWEYLRFGCVLEYTDSQDTPVYIMPDDTLVIADSDAVNDYSYIAADYDNGQPDDPATTSVNEYIAPENPLPPTDMRIDPGVANTMGYSFGPAPASDDCARVNVPDVIFGGFIPSFLDCDADPNVADGDIIENCILVSLDLFNSLSDADGDGLFNGVEEALGSEPIDNIGSFVGADSDSDGLTDAAEVGIGSCPSSTSLSLTCVGVLDSTDSDGDGLIDGDELCEIEGYVADPYDPNLVSGDTGWEDGCLSNGSSDDVANPWHNTDPLDGDTDGDDIGDGVEVGLGLEANDADTDDDGLDDYRELNGFLLDIYIDGVFYESASISGSLAYAQSITDRDGDGISDGDEVYGRTAVTNAIDTVAIYPVTRPDLKDTDGDGICDGPANLSDGVCTGLADINPIMTDTDGDGLTDGEEQLTYLTQADNVHSDTDVDTDNGEICQDFNGATRTPIEDGEEMRGSQAYTDINGDLVINDADLNADTADADDYNALDWDSDGDGLSDCDEVYIYGTNPYRADSDGDAAQGISPDEWDDAYEVNNMCLDPTLAQLNTDPLIIACLGASTDDLDFDGVPDTWECIYYTPTLPALCTDNDENSDTDNDGLTMLQEYIRNTNPILEDTDLDGIRDGYEIGSDPRTADTDGDGLIDGREIDVSTGLCPDSTNDTDLVDPGIQGFNPYTCYASNPRLDDTDLDGLLDGYEVGFNLLGVEVGPRNANLFGTNPAYTTNPILADSDGDGLKDGDEETGYAYSHTVYTQDDPSGLTVTYSVALANLKITNPSTADTDGDGLSDFNEIVRYGLDPTDTDTDDDGIQDGTTFDSATSTIDVRGEFSNDFDPTYTGYFTQPDDHDSDGVDAAGDGLSDWQEINPSLPLGSTYLALNPYTVTYKDSGANDVVTAHTLLGYDPDNSSDPTRLNPRIADTDGDGLSDGAEMSYVGSTLTGTHPLEWDTDGDLVSDGDELNDGDPTSDPLVYTNTLDPDVDGLLNADEASFGTSTTDADTDDDGLNDRFEFDKITIAYGWIEFDGTTTTIHNFNAEVATIGDADTTGNSPFGYSDGFDSDQDGIMDSFEIYWNDQANADIDTSNGFTTFAAAGTPAGAAGQCTYLTDGNLPNVAPFIVGQPLDPIKIDTDEDGLYDNYECENGLNPFDGGITEGYQYTSKIDDGDLLLAVSLASSGDYEGAFDALVLAGANLDGSGRVQVTINRDKKDEIGIDLSITCDDAYNGTITADACGTPNEPANAANTDADNAFTTYLAPAVIIDYIRADFASANELITIVLTP